MRTVNFYVACKAHTVCTWKDLTCNICTPYHPALLHWWNTTPDSTVGKQAERDSLKVDIRQNFVL